MARLTHYLFYSILFLSVVQLPAQPWRVFEDRAQLHLSENNLPLAIDDLEKALKAYIDTEGRKDGQYVVLLTTLANLISQSDEPARAEGLFTEALLLIEKIDAKQTKTYALTANNLARLYQRLGDFYKAEPLYQQAREIYGAISGRDNEEYAVMVNNLATLYYEYGQFAQAEKYYLESKRIFETVIGRDHPGYGLACNNLGALYYRKGQYILATALLIRALNNREKALGKLHPDYANTLGNLAMLYQVMKDWQKAEAALLEVKNVRQAAYGKNHPLFAASCNNLASLYFRQNRIDEARNQMQEALRIFTQAYGTRHPDYIRALINMAELEEISGYPEKAYSLLKNAADAILYHVLNNFAYLSENERESFYRQLSYHFESFYSFVLAHHNQIPELKNWALQNSITTKGLLLKSYRRMDYHIRKSGDTELLNMYEKWLRAKKALMRAESLTAEEIRKQGVDIETLAQQVSQLEKELALRSAAFREETSTKKITPNDIRKQLKPDEALVDMVRIRYKEPIHGLGDSVIYLAFIVKPTGQTQPELVVFPEGNKMEQQSLAFYRDNIIKTVTSGRKDYRSYAVFWKPIQDALTGSRTVYIVPDGLYHQINIETLYNPLSGNYVADEVKIRLLGNPSDLIDYRNSGSTKRSMREYRVYCFGYPNYSGEEKKKEVRDSFGESEKKASRFWDETTGTITVLNGTLREVNTIFSLLKDKVDQVKILVGNEANEENVKQLQQPDILHIATHGFFWPTDEAADNLRNEHLMQNPLRRSGLVLARAELAFKGLPVQGEDGILYADEVTTLSLENTALVVLSACETGLGEIMNGEGVYGLQRSFQQAGARAVLMSLWPVSDEATVDLMTAFYQACIAGKTKHDALDEARKLIRKKYDHPFYWGAFVLIGE